MPPHARWRRSRIVEPQTQSREQELSGGIKNALDRGETLVKAKQSFINAGYTPEEIESAVKSMSVSSQIPRQPLGQGQPLVQGQQQVTTPKKSSKKLIIIMSIIGIIIVITAAVLGLFWNKIF